MIRIAYNPLNADEMALCIAYAKNGNRKAMQKIIESVFPYALSYGKRYMSKGLLTYADLVSIVGLAVKKTVDRYEGGFMFSTYFVNSWLKHEIHQHCSSEFSAKKNCEFDESYMGEAHDAESINVHDLIAKLENARDRAVMTATANGLSCREIEESTGIGRMTVQRTQDRVIATLRKMVELGQ